MLVRCVAGPAQLVNVVLYLFFLQPAFSQAAMTYIANTLLGYIDINFLKCFSGDEAPPKILFYWRLLLSSQSKRGLCSLCFGLLGEYMISQRKRPMNKVKSSDFIVILLSYFQNFLIQEKRPPKFEIHFFCGRIHLPLLSNNLFSLKLKSKLMHQSQFLIFLNQ